MDNIIEYLVAIIFIISFLSEIFKKKKGGTTVPPSNSKKSQDQDTYSIPDRLDDAFRIKVQKGKPVQKKMDSYVSATIGKTNPYQTQYSYDTSISAKDAIITSEDSLIQRYEKRKNSESTIPSFVNQNTAYSTEQMQDFKDNINDIKKELFNYSSLRDFVVVSEVLGKPLALRKKCQRTF